MRAAFNDAKIRSPTPYPSQEGRKYKTLETNEFPSLEGLGVGSQFSLNLASFGATFNYSIGMDGITPSKV
jgi:hypothetical protein